MNENPKWKGLIMTNLETVERALRTKSFQFAESGNYDSAKKLMSLAERTRLLKSEIETTDAAASVLERDSGSAIDRETDFPRFWIERDVLRKMGAGRDGKSTYIHGIPKKDFDEVLKK